MTGPEHYRTAGYYARQADRLFDEFVQAHDEDGDTPDVQMIRRQVEHCREMGVLHATAALAAATALLGPVAAGGHRDGELDAWKTAGHEGGEAE